jgi:hypothetical protein
MSFDAHQNEYLGAVAGMTETYGPRLPERGEAVRGVSAGKRWSGTCVHSDQFRLIVEIDTESFVTVPTADLESD